MNKLIEEIYLKATKSIIGNRDIDAEQLALLSTIDEYDLKFAELIVLECVKFADEHVYIESGSIGNELKEHFGLQS